jgi:hypothetical protein
VYSISGLGGFQDDKWVGVIGLHWKEGGVHGKEEGGHHLGLEGEVIVLTAERDL